MRSPSRLNLPAVPPSGAVPAAITGEISHIEGRVAGVTYQDPAGGAQLYVEVPLGDGIYAHGATVQVPPPGVPLVGVEQLPPGAGTAGGPPLVEIGPAPDQAGTALGERLQGIESQQASTGVQLGQTQQDLAQATQDLAQARQDLLARLAAAQESIDQTGQLAQSAQSTATGAAQTAQAASASAASASSTAQQATARADQASSKAQAAQQAAQTAQGTADAAMDHATNGTVTTGRIVPGGQLLTGGLHLAPQSITLRELLVTDQLAAAIGNFLRVTTQNLVAGHAKITAELLASEIRLATRLIAGDPAGTHAVLDPTGLRVKRALPTGGTSEVVRLGVSGSSDYLGVVAANGDLLAAIDDGGRVTAQALAVAGAASVETLEVGGVGLTDVIDSRVTCQIARVAKSGAHWYVAGQPKAAGSKLQIFEFSVTNPFDYTLSLLVIPPTLTVYVSRAGRVDVSWWATNSGAVPTEANNFQGASATAWGGGDVAVTLPPLPTGLEPGRTLRVRCVVSATVPWDLSRNQTVYSALLSLGTPSVSYGARGEILNVSSGGAVAPAKKRYTREYAGTWGASYALNGSPAPAMDPKAVQGYGGGPQRMGMIGFQSMTGDLTGADIEKVEAYVYFPHWWYASGGTAAIGFHGQLYKPSWWSGTHADVLRDGVPKPGGVWVTLPSWTHDRWKSGAYRGLTLRAPGDSTDGRYYGYADHTRSKIRVTYLK